MYRIVLSIFLFLSIELLSNSVIAQDNHTVTGDVVVSTPNDSIKVSPIPKKDSLVLRNKHIPSHATLRSTFLPGLGQAYNREYWKIPIIYAILGIPTYTYLYNDKYYKITKFAYQATYKAQYNGDSTDYYKINSAVKGLSLNSLQTYRNAFKRDRDYSVLWFLIVWGLNIVDASVFANLKDFNVSNDLSLHVQPSFQPLSKSTGISLVFNHKPRSTQKIIAIQ